MATTLYHESRTVRGSTSEGLTVVSTYRCTPYQDYVPALAQMLGGVEMAGGRLVRILPLRDSVHPWLFCQEVEVEGVGNFLPTAPADPATMLAATNYYDQGARLICTFKPYAAGGEGADSATADQAAGDTTTPANELQLSLADETADFAAQSLALPDKYFQWVNAGLPEIVANTGKEQINATKTYARIDYALVRHQVLALPKFTIASLLQRINKSPFAGWPAECVRFDGLGVARKVTTNDLPYMDLTYKFAIQPTYDVYWVGPTDGDTDNGFVGWNRVFHPQKNRWERIQMVSSTRGIHLLDEDIWQDHAGTIVKGFMLLFDPKAV